MSKKKKVNKTKKSKEELRTKILNKVSPGKLDHTLGVETAAIMLAKRIGYDIEKASIAACAHDCCKHIKDEMLVEYIRKINPKEKLKLESYHALAASIMCKNEFGIEDKNIINSVKFHSIPRTKMSKLDKIIYLADWIEPNREGQVYDIIREIANESIELAIIAGIDVELNVAIYRGEKINPRFIKARNQLLLEIPKREK